MSNIKNKNKCLSKASKRISIYQKKNASERSNNSLSFIIYILDKISKRTTNRPDGRRVYRKRRKKQRKRHVPRARHSSELKKKNTAKIEREKNIPYTLYAQNLREKEEEEEVNKRE